MLLSLLYVIDILLLFNTDKKILNNRVRQYHFHSILYIGIMLFFFFFVFFWRYISKYVASILYVNYNLAKHLIRKTRLTELTIWDPDLDLYQNETEPKHW